MKRRSFLQYVIGGVTALFLPKSTKPDIITANGTDKTIKWSKVGNPNDWKEPRKIKWLKWADIKCPCDRCQQVKTLVDRQRQTLDELCRDVITNEPTKTRKFWTKAEIDEIVNIM